MTGEELRAGREGLGMDRTQFAAYLGVAYGTLVQWEQGRHAPRLDDFSLRVALATARQAKAAGLALPDWRKAPVLPGPVVGPDPVTSGAREGEGE